LKRKKIFEGKSKKVYETDNDNELILEFKDDARDAKGYKKGSIKGKGAVNNQISIFLLKLLESYHIPTHIIKEVSDKEMSVKKMGMVGVVVLVRNIAVGQLAKRFGVAEGKELECPLVEYYLKDGDRDDPMINDSHIISFGHATSEEMREIYRLASKCNAILKAFFRRRHLNLVDLRLEFGRHNGRITVGDEISLDTCSFIRLDLPAHARLQIIPMTEQTLAELKKKILAS
jgi:phosphoribosylaminoimidazole-succinocarboxamide synthase